MSGITYFRNSNTADLAPNTEISSDLVHLAQDGNGNQVAVGKDLNWAAFPSASAKWESHALLAYVSPTQIAISGYFISLDDDNTDLIGAFPKGYKPINFNKLAPSTITSNAALHVTGTAGSGNYGTLGSDVTAMNNNRIDFDFTYIANPDQSIND